MGRTAPILGARFSAKAHLAVRNLPGSGTTGELLAEAGIDANHIADARRDLVTQS
jgi:hypothetical protein